MSLQPGDKNWCNRQREPNDRVRGEFRSSLGCGGRDARDLVFIDPWNDRSNINSNWNTRLMKLGDGIELGERDSTLAVPGSRLVSSQES